MEVIDFCCGAGGFSEGLRQAGLTPILGIDSWNLAIQSYHDNFHKAKKLVMKVQKVTAAELPDAEVIVGSPPCQEASPARGKHDSSPDWTILEHILDLIEEKSPVFWILENVTNYWRRMPEYLKKRIPKKLNVCANDYALYHQRRRTFFGDFPDPVPGFWAPLCHMTPLASEAKKFTMSGKEHGGKVLPLWQTIGRVPSKIEMLMAMGFPPDYRLAGTKRDQIRQAGNAVCPPVARAFGQAMMEQFPGGQHEN